MIVFFFHKSSLDSIFFALLHFEEGQKAISRHKKFFFHKSLFSFPQISDPALEAMISPANNGKWYSCFSSDIQSRTVYFAIRRRHAWNAQLHNIAAFSRAALNMCEPVTCRAAATTARKSNSS